MKSASSGIQTQLAAVSSSLVTCWRLERRDGTVLTFTEHDRDLEIDGETYAAATGYGRTAVASNADMAIDNVETIGVLDDEALSDDDIRAGRYDLAVVRIFMVDWSDPDEGQLKVRKGWIGEIRTREGRFEAELRGLAQALTRQFIELVTPICAADLGDARCKIPIRPDVIARETAYAVGDYVRVQTGEEETSDGYESRIYQCVTAGTTAATQPTYDTTVGDDTTDGTAVFRAVQAWTRSGVVGTVTDNRTFTITFDEADARAVDGWFDYGVLTFEDGDNIGIAAEVKTWDADTSTATLFMPLYFTPLAGDRLRVHPGCDRLHATCKTKFDNIVNRRAFDYVQGQRLLLSLAHD